MVKEGGNETLCGYRSKFCGNERAQRPNGQLHKLCEFHRQQANSCQKRLQERRRLLEKHMEPNPINKDTLDQFTPLDSSDDFSPEDLQMLEELLFSDDDEMVRQMNYRPIAMRVAKAV